MKATAIAPANIAFIKYWGKTDLATRVPRNNSLSMNLSAMYTTTTVKFSPDLTQDQITFIDEEIVQQKEIDRIIKALNAIRKKTNIQLFAKVATKNSFPKAIGIASSASGFASLATAAFAALNKPLSEKDLSLFCRTLSGTACRSIPSGFVEWDKGSGPDDSFAHSLYPPEYWDICDVIAIVSKSMKKVGSTEGHAIADTSPFYESRIATMGAKTEALKKALSQKDFYTFGKIIEAETLNMHAICLTSQPSLIYWEPTTIAIMKSTISWRDYGEVESYFTIDAGPSVHVMCKAGETKKVAEKLQAIEGVQNVVINTPAQGARLVEEHLF